MKEKGRTPSGMSEAGYIQALENFVYYINQIAKQVAAMPGNDLEKVASLIGRGDVYLQLKEQIDTLDAIVPTIAETYGYTEKQVENDITERFGDHFGDFLLESILEDIQK